MYLVGLTGGIASGKSTVARRFQEHGAVLIDADLIARDVVRPGTSGIEAIVDRFGPEILGSDGKLDREALGAIVFADEQARKDLESITHPLIGQVIAEQIASYRETDRIVLVDVPLLVEGNLSNFDCIVVVAADPALQIARLVETRGMTVEKARARIGAQAPLEEKLARADHVIWNEGSLDELMTRVDEVWQLLQAEARSGECGGFGVSDSREA